ncbi:MAG: Ig-like domain-containing protein [Novipirellula sp. JB048]
MLAADVDTNLGQFEPNIVVNPADPSNVIVAQFNQLAISTDYGRTFPTTINAQIPAGLPADYGFGGDPSMAFDATGRLFWTYLISRDVDGDGNRELADGDDLSVAVQEVNPTSGALIGNAIDLTPGAHVDDKQWIAIDSNPASPFANNIYLVWTRLDGPDTVMFSRSINGGTVFSPPSDVSGTNGGNGFVWPSHLAVAQNGDLYVGWHNDTNGAANATMSIVRDSTGGLDLQNATPVQSTTFQAAVSTNVQTTANAIPQTNFWTQGSNQPYILPDPVRPGNVYVVVNDDPDDDFTTFPPPSAQDPGDVMIFRSTDYGQTFNAPIRVDGSPAGTFQTMPNAAIDENGNIAVSWYDTRSGNTNAGGNLLLDLYAATSLDGGLTWSNDFRVNDAQFDPDLNAPTRFNGPPPTTRIGEYNGIAATNGTVFLAWTGNDTNQEVFFDAFDMRAPFEDDYEPNNTLASATALGSLPEITLQATLHNAADRDHYQYTAHSTGKATSKLYFNATVADLQLRIFDEDGDLLTTVGGGPIAAGVQSNLRPGVDVEELTIPVIQGQHYLYEVFSNDVIVNPADYTLEIENFPVPIPTRVELVAASDSGMSNVDDVTNNSRPTLEFFSASLANFIVGVTPNTLLNAVTAVLPTTGYGMFASLISQATGVDQEIVADPVGTDGTLWRWTPTAAIAEGTYYVTAASIVIDGATSQNAAIGDLSEPIILTIDTTAPVAPGLPDLLAVSDSGLFDDDNVTNIQAVAIAGADVEPNTKVRVFSGTQLVGQGMATTTGEYEITTQPHQDGVHEITVELEDLAGNVSERSVALEIEIDTLAPNLPFLDLVEADDTGRHNDDDITRIATPDFTATSEDPNEAIHLLAANLVYRIFDRDEGSTERLLFDSGLLAPAADPVAANNLALTENQWNNLKLEVEDRAGNLSHDFLLDVLVDTTAPPAPTIALDPAFTDSGIATDPATLADRITNTTTPGFVGTAEANNIVRLYADGPFVTSNVINASDTAIGLTVAVPLDGDEAFPTGQYRALSTVNLNDGFPRDGHRQIGATSEDLAGNVSTAAFLDILLDTTPPTVTAVDYPDGSTVFASKPDLKPTPKVDYLLITFAGGPPAAAGLSSPAVDPDLAADIRHYQLVGDHSGNVLIDNALIVSNTPEQVVVRLEFAELLPDDRYTLKIDDAISDAAGNSLDGDSSAQAPGTPAIVLPSGNGISGGDFLARFTVDSRPEFGTISQGLVYVDINGNHVFDPEGQDNDATNRDFVMQFGQLTDALFAGNFADQDTGIASGFDKLGAYGRFHGTYSFLIDTDDDGGGDFASAMPGIYQVNGIPVAGDFSAAKEGDEIGLFDGQAWYLDTNGNNRIDVGERIAANYNGLPIVGDFNGDGRDDLAVYVNDTNQFIFDTNRDGIADFT